MFRKTFAACPFCAKRVTELRCGDGYYVECAKENGGCGARGPSRPTLAGAEKAFNNRRLEYELGMTVFCVRKTGSEKTPYTVREGVLREIGYTNQMKLAGRAYGCGGVLGEVIFKYEADALAACAEKNREYTEMINAFKEA